MKIGFLNIFFYTARHRRGDFVYGNFVIASLALLVMQTATRIDTLSIHTFGAHQPKQCGYADKQQPHKGGERD